MASTTPRGGEPVIPDWRSAGLTYYSRGFFCRARFGGRVWKISLDAGLTCPNRDGTLGTGGCIFCDPESFSPSRRLGQPSITAQLAEGARRLRARYGADRFVAYFQPATNTYAPAARLREVYEEALAGPGVVGLAIGTRPDCVPEPVLDLLAECSRRTWLTVEYGLQSIHDRSLAWMNRGHDTEAFRDAVRRSHARGLEVGAHVILGLPGESLDDMRATARALTDLGIASVKIHNLYAVRNTPLAEMLAAGELRLPGREEYVGYVVAFLEELSPGCVVDRLSGDAPRQYLVAPAWCLDKQAVRAAVEAEFHRRGSWQGRGFKDER